MARSLAFLALLAVLAAACGDDDGTTQPPATDATTTTTAPSTTDAPTTTVATTTTTMAPTTTTMAPTTTTTMAPTDTDWTGEPYDFWVPVAGEGPIVGVVGVEHDDTLNVRAGPGTSFDVIAELDPTLTGISGTGNGWQLPSGAVWWEIEVGDVTGWASQQYLSRLDGVDDLTSLVVARLGEIPAAETMVDLGLTVGNVFVFEEGGSLAMTVAPSVGDLGEVTFDVIGIGDDSLAGYRLHVFGQPSEGGEGFSLMSVEATIFCQRGVNDGICV